MDVKTNFTITALPFVSQQNIAELLSNKYCFIHCGIVPVKIGSHFRVRGMQKNEGAADVSVVPRGVEERRSGEVSLVSQSPLVFVVRGIMVRNHSSCVSVRTWRQQRRFRRRPTRACRRPRHPRRRRRRRRRRPARNRCRLRVSRSPRSGYQ